MIAFVGHILLKRSSERRFGEDEGGFRGEFLGQHAASPL